MSLVFDIGALDHEPVSSTSNDREPQYTRLDSDGCNLHIGSNLRWYERCGTSSFWYWLYGAWTHAVRQTENSYSLLVLEASSWLYYRKLDLRSLGSSKGFSGATPRLHPYGGVIKASSSFTGMGFEQKTWRRGWKLSSLKARWIINNP